MREHHLPESYKLFKHMKVDQVVIPIVHIVFDILEDKWDTMTPEQIEQTKSLALGYIRVYEDDKFQKYLEFAQENVVNPTFHTDQAKILIDFAESYLLEFRNGRIKKFPEIDHSSLVDEIKSFVDDEYTHDIYLYYQEFNILFSLYMNFPTAKSFFINADYSDAVDYDDGHKIQAPKLMQALKQNLFRGEQFILSPNTNKRHRDTVIRLCFRYLESHIDPKKSVHYFDGHPITYEFLDEIIIAANPFSPNMLKFATIFEKIPDYYMLDSFELNILGDIYAYSRANDQVIEEIKGKIAEHMKLGASFGDIAKQHDYYIPIFRKYLDYFNKSGNDFDDKSDNEADSVSRFQSCVVSDEVWIDMKNKVYTDDSDNINIINRDIVDRLVDATDEMHIDPSD